MQYKFASTILTDIVHWWAHYRRMVQTLCLGKQEIQSLIKPHKKSEETWNAEQLFYEQATLKGYTVYRSGWPDYLITKDNKIIFVEVKGRGDKLRDSQKAMLKILSEHGLKCFVWSPHKGFERFNQSSSKHLGSGPLLRKSHTTGTEKYTGTLKLIKT